MSNKSSKLSVVLFVTLSVMFVVVSVGSVLVTTASISLLKKIHVTAIESEASLGVIGGISTFGSITTASVTVSNNATSTILSANTGRQYALITNASTTGTVRLGLNKTSDVTSQGSVILEAGESYEINQDNPYVGEIEGWNLTAGTSTVVTIEH